MKYSKNYIDFLSDLEAVLRKHNATIEAKMVLDKNHLNGIETRLYLKTDCEYSYGSTGDFEYSFDADELKDVIEVLKNR